MAFGVRLAGRGNGNFPDSIVSNNILFRFTGQNYESKDQANLEAIYTKREGYYVRVKKVGSRYGVYAADKH